MKILYTLAICTAFMQSLFMQSLTSASAPNSLDTTEEQVVATAKNFFNTIDIKNQSSEKYREVVTDDFLIFELGKQYTIDGLVKLFESDDREWISTKWTLSDFRISLDTNSAHASFQNHGVFRFKKNGKTYRSDLHWLESAYMIREGKSWKIRFFQSNRASEKTVEIE